MIKSKNNLMQKIISTYSDNLFGKPFSMPQFIESSENDTLAHYNCENNKNKCSSMENIGEG